MRMFPCSCFARAKIASPPFPRFPNSRHILQEPVSQCLDRASWANALPVDAAASGAAECPPQRMRGRRCDGGRGGPPTGAKSSKQIDVDSLQLEQMELKDIQMFPIAMKLPLTAASLQRHINPQLHSWELQL